MNLWWTQENQNYFEDFHDIRFADVNGDGVMEIFVDWLGYEASGSRIYTLRGGKPVETELSYFNGL